MTLPSIILGADHAGFRLKKALCTSLQEKAIAYQDVGCFDENRVDYPQIVSQVIQQARQIEGVRGILCCGSGIGVAMSANRYPGIRAVVAHDLYTAKMSRLHNDSNVLCLGGRFIAPELAIEILDLWLSTPFEGGRHAQRLQLMDSLPIVCEGTSSCIP